MLALAVRHSPIRTGIEQVDFSLSPAKTGLAVSAGRGYGLPGVSDSWPKSGVSQDVVWTSMKRIVICLLACVLSPSLCRAQAPIFVIAPSQSWIRFNVNASVAIAGRFDKWDASLTFKSPDETTGTLAIRIRADSVDTGSGMKNSKLKGKDFFDVQEFPEITFVSNKVVPTGLDTYEVEGAFTIRGVSNREKLKMTVSGRDSGSGMIQGTMVFNRKDYGMNKGIPFIKIADQVDVGFHLRIERVSGPALAIRR
jgi:polyisoprenoid-binding protein YceI